VLIIGGTINEFISSAQKSLQQYQWLVKDYNLLCPPTVEGIKIYCTTGNDHVSYHDHVYKSFIPEDDRGNNSNSLIIACESSIPDSVPVLVVPQILGSDSVDVATSSPSQDWQDNIDKMIQELTNGVNACSGTPDFNKEVEIQKNKLSQLQQLNTEYLALKDTCGIQ